MNYASGSMNLDKRTRLELKTVVFYIRNPPNMVSIQVNGQVGAVYEFTPNDPNDVCFPCCDLVAYQPANLLEFEGLSWYGLIWNF